MCTYQHSMFAGHVLRKNDIFCGMYKKDKKASHEKPFLAPNLFFFTHDTKNIGFLRTTL